MRIIAGEWRGRTILAPEGREVRPTTDRVREAWMSALGSTMVDARVLDLFAGSGALGLETLSRGAREVVFVENLKKSLDVLGKNIASLGADVRTKVVRKDVSRFLDTLPDFAFDLALADPPYGEGEAARLLKRISNRPFALALWVEYRSDEELPELPGLQHRRYGDTTLTIWENPE
jgi:16S rRNA (guanine966-N2)-methyltransferase